MDSQYPEPESLLAHMGDGLFTAAELAEKTGLCQRTIYRHIGRLRVSGHNILSDAGVGYMLRRKNGGKHAG